MKHIDNILLVGHHGALIDELMKKLNKEGLRVYLLTSEGPREKPAHVFEQYLFDYQSDSVAEVIASCRADVIVYAGAHDPLYAWTAETRRADARHMVAGLSNLLTCAAEQEVRHFMYLSCGCVFEKRVGDGIDEDVPPAPASQRGMSALQGERLAASFAHVSPMEVSVVRLADLYFPPHSARECADPILRMCLSALQGRDLAADGRRIWAPLYVSDAVQAIFLLLSAPARRHDLYHVAAAQEVSEYDIAQTIRRTCERPIAIVDHTAGVARRQVLSGRRLREEFGFEARVQSAEAVPAIVRFMQRRRNQFDAPRARDRRPKWLQQLLGALGKVLPPLECLLLFPLVLLLSHWAAQSPDFRHVNFYLLYVMLFAVVRGRQLALLAFALSVVGYCYGQAQARAALALMMDVGTYIWVAQLFIVGIAAGSLRDRLLQIEREKDEEIRFLSGRVEDIALINASNTRIKNYFEEHLFNSNESIGWFYDIITQFDNAESGEVVFIASGLLAKIMESAHVAIYAVANHEYCRLVTSTTPRARLLGKSIRMVDHESIFAPLRAQKIFVNRSMDAQLPSMASALIDSDGQMQIAIFLWDMKYEKMTLYATNTLKVVGALIQNAMLRAAKYMDALAHARYLPRTRILSQAAFGQMQDIHRKASQANLTAYSVLALAVGDTALPIWSKQLDRLVRSSDAIGLLSSTRLGILLTNTSAEEAQTVIDRLKGAGIAVEHAREGQAR